MGQSDLAFTLLSQPSKHQPRAKSPSGGRAEVLRRGTSRMDAATTAWMQEVERSRMPEPRGLKGQGWPL